MKKIKWFNNLPVSDKKKLSGYEFGHSDYTKLSDKEICVIYDNIHSTEEYLEINEPKRKGNHRSPFGIGA